MCLSVWSRLVDTVLLSDFTVSLSLSPPCWYCAAVRLHCVSQSVAALLILCCCQTSLCLSVCRRLVDTVLLSDFTVSLSLSLPCWPSGKASASRQADLIAEFGPIFLLGLSQVESYQSLTEWFSSGYYARRLVLWGQRLYWSARCQYTVAG